MNIRKLKFVCDKIPDHFTMHSLLNTITDNYFVKNQRSQFETDYIYKILIKDNLIEIYIEDNINIYLDEHPLSFNHNNGFIRIKLISNEIIINQNNFNIGDRVNIRGIISYCVNVTENGVSKKYCPIDFRGNFVNKKTKDGLTLRQKTFNFLEKETGLSFNNELINKDDLRFEAINYKNYKKEKDVFSSNGNKMDFHNLFFLNCDAIVIDNLKCSLLNVNSIGRRRSYGFGNMIVTSFSNNLLSNLNE